MNKIFIIIPTYFDGRAVLEIIVEIQQILDLSFSNFNPHFIIVDDSCGKDNILMDLSMKISNIKNLELVKSKTNLGNQGAIISGLNFALGKISLDDLILVLDGDGEDDPKDIKILMSSILNEPTLDVVLAERGKRSTNLKFKFALFVFKVMFYILTGKKWRTGNFSIVKSHWLLENFELISTYNSYAGSIQSLKANRIYCKIDRKPRRYGSTQTSNQGKIIYALNCLTPWVEIIQVRSLLFFGFMFLTFILSIAMVLLAKFVFDSATPNWFTLVVFSTTSLSLLSLNIFLTSQLLISIVNLTKKLIQTLEAK